MGLESLELLMKVEEEFGIKIENEDIQPILTVEQLHQLICQKYSRVSTDSCISQKTFDRLRNGLVSELQIPREQIVPNAATEEFFPETNRKERWNQISKRTQLNFPKLVPSNKFQKLHRILFPFSGWLLVAMVLLSGLLVALQVTLTAWIAFWLLFGSVFMLVIMLSLGSRTGNSIPPSCHTIGGLVTSLTLLNRLPGQAYDTHQIQALLIRMIANIGCLDETEITPKSRFLQDLNFG
jgi:hypothetical protein